MDLKNIIIISILALLGSFDFYSSQKPSDNLNQKFCPIANIAPKHRLTMLRDSFQDTQGEVQDLYLKALVAEINYKHKKADDLAFKAYILSQPYRMLIDRNDSLAFHLNRLLNNFYLDDETDRLLRRALVFETTRDIFEVEVLPYQNTDLLEKIFENYKRKSKGFISSKEKKSLEEIDFFVKKFKKQDAIRKSSQPLLREHWDGKEKIIEKYKKELQRSFLDFENKRELIQRYEKDLLIFDPVKREFLDFKKHTTFGSILELNSDQFKYHMVRLTQDSKEITGTFCNKQKLDEPLSKEQCSILYDLYTLIASQERVASMPLDSGYKRSRGVMHVSKIPKDILSKLSKSIYNQKNQTSNQINIISLICFEKQIQFVYLSNLNILIWEIIEKESDPLDI